MASFKYFLAPMEDITGSAFRTVCFGLGADVTFTELVRVQALARKNQSTWSRIVFHDDTPTVIQLLGSRDVFFKKFLSDFEPKKGFLGFNLNLGCPSPRIIALGQGCAMVRRISKVKKLAAIIRDAGYGFSVKMRLGLNKQDKDNRVYLNLIDAVDADYFVVHARYGSQTYAEPADHSVFEKCVAFGKTIIANGDIKSLEQVELLKNAGVKGAMIGRAAVREPWIFARLKGLDFPSADEVSKQYMSLAKKFDEPFRYQKNFLKHFSRDTSFLSESVA